MSDSCHTITIQVYAEPSGIASVQLSGVRSHTRVKLCSRIVDNVFQPSVLASFHVLRRFMMNEPCFDVRYQQSVEQTFAADTFWN